MKKRITIILLFIPFWANCVITAQIELSEDWTFKSDKGKHIIVASAMSATIYPLVYHKTKDEGLAFRAAIIIPAFPIIIWEGVRMLDGKEISLSDMGYGLGSCVITSGLMYVGTKIIKKRKEKKRLKEFNNWSLDNEFINKSINLNLK